MIPQWHFTEIPPNVRIREPQIEKFFSSDAVVDRAEALIREGIQNSLDAMTGTQLRIRVGIGRWDDESHYEPVQSNFAAFWPHIDACRSKITSDVPPQSQRDFRFMTFEDFGTSGLLGDPRQSKPVANVKNGFFNYFRGEGISDKDEGDRGRHGVGKYTFAGASQIRATLAMTRRLESGGTATDLLMGTAVLRIHDIDSSTYLPDGWFGIPSSDPSDRGLVMPISDSESIAAFKRLFKLARSDETGLSVVIPYLDPTVDVTSVTRAILAGFFYPILTGTLLVEVVDEHDQITVIDSASIQSVVQNQPAALASQMQPLFDLTQAAMNPDGFTQLSLPPDPDSPKWDKACIPESARPLIHDLLENQDVVKLTVPVNIREKKGGQKIAHESEMKLILKRDPSCDEGQVVFIRRGLLITDVRSNNRQIRCPGVRALVIINQGPLAKMLGDSENPAHTQWQYQLVKDKYVNAGVCINYVAASVPSVLRVLSDEQKKADPSLLIDLFSLPSQTDEGPKAKQKKKKKPGETETKIIDPPPAKPKRWRLQKLADGFVIRPGDPAAQLPPALEIIVAYDVRRGNALAKYRPADFRLGLGGIDCDFTGCEQLEFEDNWIVVKITDPAFEFKVTGFDTRRDLHIDVRVKDIEEATNATAA
jgi:hypothetical protein